MEIPVELFLPGRYRLAKNGQTLSGLGSWRPNNTTEPARKECSFTLIRLLGTTTIKHHHHVVQVLFKALLYLQHNNKSEKALVQLATMIERAGRAKDAGSWQQQQQDPAVFGAGATAIRSARACTCA